jgi:hypothetical protein
VDEKADCSIQKPVHLISSLRNDKDCIRSEVKRNSRYNRVELSRDPVAIGNQSSGIVPLNDSISAGRLLFAIPLPGHTANINRIRQPELDRFFVTI